VLALFDVDGTLLLRASEDHRRAMHAALRHVFGIADPGSVRVAAAGRTDGQIARNILLLHGVSADRIDARMDALREACCREFARRCPPDLSGTVAPGMRELLDALTVRDGVTLALLTGNYEPIARLKMERAGLARYFDPDQGAFGSDSEDRAELPPIARRRAGRDGHPYPRERTIVIGDTPNDVACAHADGVRCFAVATGPFPAEELAQADAVVRDATELADLLAEAATA
jgi:phosphoglycolate phosphatase